MPRAPARRAPRCTYKEGRRQCPFDAVYFAPDLCQSHRLVVEEAARPRTPMEVLTEVLHDMSHGRPMSADYLNAAAQRAFAGWAARQNLPRQGGFPGHAHAPRPAGHAGTRNGAAPRPPFDPDEEARRVARQVMGFGPTERLTDAMVKARKRTLAIRFHPDKSGGSEERMKVINDAADILLHSL